MDRKAPSYFGTYHSVLGNTFPVSTQDSEVFVTSSRGMLNHSLWLVTAFLRISLKHALTFNFI